MKYVHNHLSFDAERGVISLTSRFFFVVLRREQQSIETVQMIDALNRDSFTNDEIFLRFHATQGGLVISEFDTGFRNLVEALTPSFPGIERWQEVSPRVPLTDAVLMLWERSGRDVTPDSI